MKWKPLVLLIFLLTHVPALGQNPKIDPDLPQLEGLQVIQTTRGDIFFGKTLVIEADSIVFQLRYLDALSFGRDEIKWLGLVDDAGWLKDEISNASHMETFYDLINSYWPENLAYSSTAFPYPKGGGEYRNVSILYNVFDTGLSDNLSIGGGMVIPFLFLIRSKLAYSLGEKLHLGAGFNNFLGLNRDTEGLISHLFAIGTFGSTQQYFNITAGVAHNWEFPDDSPFIITAGGAFSFANNWKCYADVGVSPGNEGIIPTIMLSWFKKQNRLEIGMLGVTDGLFSAIPLIGYARRF